MSFRRVDSKESSNDSEEDWNPRNEIGSEAMTMFEKFLYMKV